MRCEKRVGARRQKRDKRGEKTREIVIPAFLPFGVTNFMMMRHFAPFSNLPRHIHKHSHAGAKGKSISHIFLRLRSSRSAFRIFQPDDAFIRPVAWRWAILLNPLSSLSQCEHADFFPLTGAHHSLRTSVTSDWALANVSIQWHARLSNRPPRTQTRTRADSAAEIAKWTIQRSFRAHKAKHFSAPLTKTIYRFFVNNIFNGKLASAKGAQIEESVTEGNSLAHNVYFSIFNI